ncbi:LOW QUALITY PROTEIN: prolyl-tRNA synthetase associated domain-containing protein 1-like [Haliotis rubra]|uniref:LOW QUALITY PROTEIN: prolyl-tRNA synthetase associated domain-containing protein 1-like n=1 Tax=Haliotis rubra TaxID=36100 RepID=UPI001EE62175|nr:LOW QUALITY PROTEIN: prolyl-tRNA synthetase associated domain-containing protein 1-like [Haliotis rubra]
MASTDSARVGKEELLAKLVEMGLDCDTHEHPEVFTVEQAIPHVSHLEGMFAKNLFLRDKKKKLYLFCAAHDADIKLNDLAKAVKAPGGLRFADESILSDKLGLQQGSVTIFGLINDKVKDVQLLMDSRFIGDTYTRLYFHPMTNAASTGISPSDLSKFLEAVDHKPTLVDIGAIQAAD